MTSTPSPATGSAVPASTEQTLKPSEATILAFVGEERLWDDIEQIDRELYFCESRCKKGTKRHESLVAMRGNLNAIGVAFQKMADELRAHAETLGCPVCVEPVLAESKPASTVALDIGTEIHRLAEIVISDCGLSEHGNESLLERIVERLYKFARTVAPSPVGEGLTMTVAEIISLAHFAGIPLDSSIEVDEDERETEITIEECPKEGLSDQDGEKVIVEHFRLVAYNTEYPEEGSCGLGAALAAQAPKPDEHDSQAVETLKELGYYWDWNKSRWRRHDERSPKPASVGGEPRCPHVREDGKQCMYVAGHLFHHIYDDQKVYALAAEADTAKQANPKDSVEFIGEMIGCRAILSGVIIPPAPLDPPAADRLAQTVTKLEVNIALREWSRVRIDGYKRTMTQRMRAALEAALRARESAPAQEWIACRCYTEEQKRLCPDKRRCSEVIASAAPRAVE